MKTVSITLSHPHDGHGVGDVLELERVEAKKLVRAGAATYSTKPDALEAEGEQGAPKTVAAVRKRSSSRRSSSSGS